MLHCPQATAAANSFATKAALASRTPTRSRASSIAVASSCTVVICCVSGALCNQSSRKRRFSCWIGEEALATLSQYHWPGNVRELKNVIERVLILNPRVLRIERKHLPPLTHKAGTRSTEEFSSLQQARDAYEREYILKKIEEARNNISHAAELLGLERSHLYRKMKALGIGVRE